MGKKKMQNYPKQPWADPLRIRIAVLASLPNFKIQGVAC